RRLLRYPRSTKGGYRSMESAKANITNATDLVVTVTLIVADIARSAAFYRDVFEATVLREGEPTFLRFGNIWLIINVGCGPTDDKPNVVATPPRAPDLLSSFMNLRVKDIAYCYELWRSRGAWFITEP